MQSYRRYPQNSSKHLIWNRFGFLRVITDPTIGNKWCAQHEVEDLLTIMWLGQPSISTTLVVGYNHQFSVKSFEVNAPRGRLAANISQKASWVCVQRQRLAWFRSVGRVKRTLLQSALLRYLNSGRVLINRTKWLVKTKPNLSTNRWMVSKILPRNAKRQ